MSLRSYRDLVVWQRSMELAEELYRLCGAMPRYEIFGVTSQLRRAASSIPANIAEGYGRGTGADRARFYEYALGSAREAREWYRAAAEVLDSDLARDRVARLDVTVSLLIGLVRDARTRTIRRDALRNGAGR